MPEPFVGEIRIFAGTFAPSGWAFCDGQLLAISQNDALFSLIGTTYGGDGTTTFALPDLRGRLPVHQGNGPGLEAYAIGSKGGLESVTPTAAQLPSHRHDFRASAAGGTDANPQGGVVGNSPSLSIFIEDQPTQSLANEMVGSSGGSQPHPNLMPSIAINQIIALSGVFPSPS